MNKWAENITNFVFGVVLIVIAVFLARQPVYSSIKGTVVDAGGSIGLAVAVALILIAAALVSGIAFLRRA